MRVTILVSLLLAALGASSCSPTSSTCIPGASAACACTDGAQGAQTCNASRTYDVCVCAAPTEDGGAVTRDAASDGGTLPAGWECLASPAPIAHAGTVEIRYLLLDATKATGTSAGTPIVGAALEACGSIDFGCANPVASTTTDDAGAAVFASLSSGFAGYYQVPSAAGFNPSLFFHPPQYVDQTQSEAMADSADITAAGAVAGVTQDPTLGFAIVSANDCNGKAAGGIVFAVANAAPSETVVYLESSVPSTSATQTDAVTGSALIFNVPVGSNGGSQSLEVSASFAESGVSIQTMSALARSGWVSYVAFEPDQGTRAPF